MRRKAVATVAAAGLIVGALAVTAAIPAEQRLTAPFVIAGDGSSALTSRTIIATVTEWNFADSITFDDEWSAEGNWLVVTLSASAPHTEDDAQIGLATLTVDGRTYTASERVPESLWRYPLRVGIGTSGVLAFELPAGVRSGSAELRLSSNDTTPALDDVISISVNLTTLDHRERLTISSPTVGAP